MKKKKDTPKMRVSFVFDDRYYLINQVSVPRIMVKLKAGASADETAFGVYTSTVHEPAANVFVEMI